MIDKKKIEEEAEQRATATFPYDAAAHDAVAEAFASGIEWYRNAVWHTDDEIPQPFGYILVNPQHHTASVQHTRRDLDLGDFDRELQWEQYCYYVNDRFTWCYLEDILQQRKEVRP